MAKNQIALSEVVRQQAEQIAMLMEQNASLMALLAASSTEG